MAKPGFGFIISAPGSPNINIEKNIVTLPPGTQTKWSGFTSTPRVLNNYSVTASLKGRIPGAGV